jgi:nitroimidazol reductase NimA-like FMN-containing flavoprotein (pyridoxamine 5'-phosphate oxidase superfamily)
MLGQLTREEIEQLLMRQVIGRIGCHADGRIFVVPIAYAYDGAYVYAHSSDGLKIRTMRANPNVCFEVEQVEDVAHWKTVVAWGVYEELWGKDEETAVALLRSRFPSIRSETTLPHPALHEGVEQTRTIFFRVRLDEKTGRFER